MNLDKHWTSIIAALLLGDSAQALELRYSDLSRQVAEKNGHVSAAGLFSASADEENGHLFRSYLPKLSGTLGMERFKTGPLTSLTEPYGSLEASLNLFHGGRDGLEDRMILGRADLARTESKIKQRTELLKARQAFWAARYAQEVQGYLTEALVQNEKNLSAARRRVSAGMGAETDRTEFEIHRTEIEHDLARTSLQNQNARRNLSALLGLETGESLALVEDPHRHEDSEDRLVIDALETRQLRLQEEISGLEHRVSSRWWMPSLDAYASHSLYMSRDRDFSARKDRFETTLGVKLTLSLFDGWMGQTRAASHATRTEAFREEARQTHLEVEAEFESAKAELKLTHDLVHGTERNVEQSEKYLAATLSEYARGIKNSPDVLSASQRLLEYKRRLAELKRDYNLAKAELLAKTGH